MSDNSWDVFVSHAHVDKPLVDEIVDDLRHSGLDVWYDRTMIKLGQRLRQAINEGIKNSKSVIVVVSVNSLHSQWVLNELDSAMLREISEKKDIVIPILIGRVSISEVPQDLAGKKFLDLRYNFKKKYNVKRNELIQRTSLPSYSKGEPLVSGDKDVIRRNVSVDAEQLSVLSDYAIIAFAGQCLNRAVFHFSAFKGYEAGPLPDEVFEVIQFCADRSIQGSTILQVIERVGEAHSSVNTEKQWEGRHIDSIYEDTDPVDDELFDAKSEILGAAVDFARAVFCVARNEDPTVPAASAVRAIIRAASHCCNARICQRYVEPRDRRRALASYGEFVRAINADFVLHRKTEKR